MAILPLQTARVSNLLLSDITSSSINKTEQNLLDIQNQLTTGKKLNLPSDNPGDAAIAMQLRKLLEQRQSFSDNLTNANNQLGEVDTSLGNITDLIQQAQSIASANVGTDVSSDARTSAAAVVDSIYNQLLSSGNQQFQGMYLYGGDLSTSAPFVEANGGVQFVGSSTTLQNTVDENASMSFNVNGADVFGALSSQVQGTADLTPSLTLTTRLSDLRGTGGSGIDLGSVQIGDGTNSGLVDLSKADTVGDVINTINNAHIGTITASLSPNGMGLQLSSSGATDNISVNEVGGGTTASDLGILSANGAGVATPLVGGSVQANVTLLTPLANLRGGAGIDTSGLTITNGTTNKTVDLSSATTVEDMLNAINGAGAAVKADINAAGTGINIINPTEGTTMTIGENGGTTATDLGVRSFGPTTQLADLNDGKGVGDVTGNDFQVTDSNGTSFQVDTNGLHTVQDVIDAINNAASTAGAGVTASFATTGNGLVLTDTAGGGGTMAVAAVNFSTAVQDLGLTAAPVGGVISGSDVNPVEPDGIFTHINELRVALRSNDTSKITEAAQGLQADFDRVVRIRGQAGAKVQEVQSRQQTLDSQNIATKSLLSSLEDVDFTSAISTYQTLQTSLQAALETAGKTLNLSLLDFLG
ncbi:MAG TPA: flagellar hook-associated protein FlgL [Tepidisphaeraceae bacterium]|nr:flagellar hook-associated protein FlgL [Tepidisphaeraceae bacterium]